jgi:histidine triad (HIT) family protein
MSEETIFSKIIKEEIPCTKLYENDYVIAIMDINPIVKGHALVISKQPYDMIFDTPDDILSEMIHAAKMIATAQKQGLGADGVNIVQNNGSLAGQAVNHIHIHIIPQFQEHHHRWNWDAKTYTGNEEMQQYADNIKTGLTVS